MYLEIEAATVKQRLEDGEDLNLIDVREEFEYIEKHIPGTILVPLGTLPQFLDNLEKDKEYIIVCRSGNRSGHATRYMQNLGFQKTKNMVGGMLAWKGKVKTETVIK